MEQEAALDLRFTSELGLSESRAAATTERLCLWHFNYWSDSFNPPFTAVSRQEKQETENNHLFSKQNQPLLIKSTNRF